MEEGRVESGRVVGSCGGVVSGRVVSGGVVDW